MQCCRPDAVLPSCRDAVLPSCHAAMLPSCRAAERQCCAGTTAMLPVTVHAAILPCCRTTMLPCCRAAASGAVCLMRVVRQAPLPRFAVIPAAPNPPNQTGQPDWPARVASPIISGVHRYRASLKAAPISVSISQYTDIGVNIANKKLGMDCGDENQWSDDDAQSAHC